MAPIEVKKICCSARHSFFVLTLATATRLTFSPLDRVSRPQSVLATSVRPRPTPNAFLVLRRRQPS